MRSRLVVLVLAAVLGTGGGVAAGLLDGGDDPDRGQTRVADDPLRLGVEHVDLGCTGQAVLVVATGDTPTALRGAVADHGDAVRYLRTADSCDTRWAQDEDRATPTWAAYLGPHDDLVEPCADRMTSAHKGDVLTVLTAGTTDLVRCVCVLPTADMPELRLGMPVDQELGIWVRALQGMLVDIDPARFPEERVTGRYDEATVARMAPLQDFHDIEPGSPVDEASWRAVRDRACGSYDF
ncbi:hypothetical protein [Nocardioides deserti]|uniref:Uncharacterized protein n=1 Tax=Nocardioides deserti TaxID=1588644 RepID=A0ABR6U4T7_9ACTN|nr:hypothetical protein [Nocardioides deserti]MBC2959447.1 hypothetical protein [Nocardioides deserti]GGO73541.1 hypothetical protein GCM10012276_19400 [Nocardioides deserti]